MSVVLLHYLKLCFLPLKLSLHHIFPIIHSFFQPEALLSFTILLVILLVGLKTYTLFPQVSFVIFYFFLTLLPVLNIIPFGGLMQERYLYFSSFGFCMLLALLFAKALNYRQSAKLLPKSLKNIWRFGGYFCVFSVLALYSLRTYNRNFDWKNDLTLWTKVLKAYPQSSVAHFFLGKEYARLGDEDKTIFSYQKALENVPQENTLAMTGDPAMIHNEIGAFYLREKNYPLAESEFKKALAVNPDFFPAINNLGIIYASQGKNEEAILEFKKAIALNPNFPEPYLNLMKIYLKKGMYEEIKDLARKMESLKRPELKKMLTHIIRLEGK